LFSENAALTNERLFCIDQLGTTSGVYAKCPQQWHALVPGDVGILSLCAAETMLSVEQKASELFWFL